MKKTLYITALLFVATAFTQTAKAQGDLQFNQVLMYDLAFNGSQAFTVPAGKVWKIESAGTSGGSCYLIMQNGAGQNLIELEQGSSSAKLPIWLPENYSGTFTYIAGSCSSNRAYISIIEFNVVP